MVLYGLISACFEQIYAMDVTSRETLKVFQVLRRRPIAATYVCGLYELYLDCTVAKNELSIGMVAPDKVCDQHKPTVKWMLDVQIGPGRFLLLQYQVLLHQKHHTREHYNNSLL